jgi:hypothetical protein
MRAGPIVRTTFWSSKLSTPRSRRHWFCIVAILCSRSLTQAGPWIIATQPALNALSECTPASFPCARPFLPSSDRSAGQRNQPSHSTVLARPVCLFVCVSAAFFSCARSFLPSSDRSAGQRNQPSHSTVLARPVCPFVCVRAASFPCTLDFGVVISR